MANLKAEQGSKSDPNNSYGCIYEAVNPNWYYFELSESGKNIIGSISNRFGIDVDYVLFGPFLSLQDSK